MGQGTCLKGMSRTITMQGFTLAAITDAEKIKLRRKNEQSQWSVKYRSRGTGSRCVLERYVKDNYYARFQTTSSHLCRENQTST